MGLNMYQENGYAIVVQNTHKTKKDVREMIELGIEADRIKNWRSEFGICDDCGDYCINIVHFGGEWICGKCKNNK